MKKITKILLVAAVLICSGNVAFGQKFGIINSQELIAIMPELDSVQIKMKAYNDEIMAQLEAITVEYNQKYDDYQAKHSTLTEAVRQLKEKELGELNTRFMNYRQVSQEEGNALQNKLMTPVIERAENAINKVAKAGGFLVVFDESVGSTVYTDKAQVTDILPLVKKELGIPADAKPRTNGAAAQQ